MKSPAQRILALPIAKWDAALARLKPDARCQVENELGTLIQRAALLYGYVGARFIQWGNGAPHKTAAKDAARRLVKIRRAMGFAYPKRSPLLESL